MQTAEANSKQTADGTADGTADDTADGTEEGTLLMIGSVMLVK